LIAIKMIGIIRYGAGTYFLAYCGIRAIGYCLWHGNSEADFEQYDRYIIPGVGHAGAAMHKLKNRPGTGYKSLTKTYFGYLCGHAIAYFIFEEGDSELLGIFPVKTLKFTADPEHKVPHTGWNRVYAEKENPLFKDIPAGSHFYFVHSYFIEYNNSYTFSGNRL
jgi:glutamine amidotransferase